MEVRHKQVQTSHLEWLFYSLIIFANDVLGHGRLIDPPSRSSAWRHGFPTPNNFNDHEIYCGGFSRQWTQNGGKCGPCGDPWDLPTPRPNEGGGVYGQGVVVRTYKQGSEIELGIELTANHYGHFEFRVCPTSDPKIPETNECFDQFVLQKADGEGEKWVPGPGSGIIFKPIYRLPENLTCLNCVLQWRYIAGNNWGMCTDGTGKVGCGAQEEFRACADITITADGLPDNSTTTVAPVTKATTTRMSLTGRPRPPYVPPPRRSTTTTQATVTTTVVNVTTEAPMSTTAVPGVKDGLDHMPHVAPYIAGLVILGALLFTLLFFICIIVYFYRGHAMVKSFIKRSGKEQRFKLPKGITSLYAPSTLVKRDVKAASQAPATQAPPPVTISHSVMAISSTLEPSAPITAPTLPITAPTAVRLPRSHSRAAPKRAPEPPARSPTTILTTSASDGVVVNNCVQRLPMAISEPMNVAINGVNVDRDRHLELTGVYTPPNRFYSGDSSA